MERLPHGRSGRPMKFAWVNGGGRCLGSWVARSRPSELQPRLRQQACFAGGGSPRAVSGAGGGLFFHFAAMRGSVGSF